MVWNQASPSPWEGALQAAQLQQSNAELAQRQVAQQAAQLQLQQAQRTNAANLQAGQQFGSGDYGAAAKTVAGAGDLAQAQTLQSYGIQQHQAQIQAIGHIVPALQQTLQSGGAQAVVSQWDQISPQLAQIGVTPQIAAQIRTGLLKDPQGTLQSVGALALKDYDYQKDDAGNIHVIDKTTGQETHVIPGQQKPVTLEPGAQLVDPNSSGGAMTPAAVSAPPASGAVNPPAPAGSSVPPQGSRAGVNLANNNPGNMKVPGSATQFQTFPDMQSGIDAVGHQIDLYRGRGLDTISEIVSKYAPSSENNTAAYIASVAARAGIPANKALTDADVPAVRDAMIAQEQGGVTPAQLLARGQTQPQQAAQPAPSTPQGPRVIASNTASLATPMTADTQAKFANGYTDAKGIPHYPNAAAVASAAPDAGIDFAAQMYLTTGKMPPGLGRSGVGALRVLQAAQQIAAQNGQTVPDLVGNQSARTATSQALNNITKLRAQVSQFADTLQNNISLLKQVIPAGAANSAPIVNRWIQAGRQSISGDPDVTKLNILIGTVKDEYAKVLSGSTGAQGITDAARRQADDFFSNASTPQQLYAAISTIQQETKGRQSALDSNVSQLNQQLRATSNGAQNASTPVRSAQGSPSGPTNIVTVTSPQQAMALPKGTTFRTPDGRLKVR